jgi:hypothetical protein
MIKTSSYLDTYQYIMKRHISQKKRTIRFGINSESPKTGGQAVNAGADNPPKSLFPQQAVGGVKGG